MIKIATLHTQYGDWKVSDGLQITGNVNVNGLDLSFRHNTLSHLITFGYMRDTRQLSFSYRHSDIFHSVVDYSNAVAEMADLHIRDMARIYGTLKKGGE